MSVLFSETITTIGISLKKIQELSEKLETNGVDTFKDVSHFPQYLQQISYHYLNLMKLVSHLAVVPEENQPMLELACILDTP